MNRYSAVNNAELQGDPRMGTPWSRDALRRGGGQGWLVSEYCLASGGQTTRPIAGVFSETEFSIREDLVISTVPAADKDASPRDNLIRVSQKTSQ